MGPDAGVIYPSLMQSDSMRVIPSHSVKFKKLDSKN